MNKLFVTLFVVLISITSFAGPGGDDESSGTRNGGNVIASEFFDKGMEILKQLQVRSPLTINNQNIDIAQIRTVFSETFLVIVERDLILNGSLVNAINYPKLNRIDISARSWEQMDTSQQRRLVIHEILGVAGIKDPQYATSYELLKAAFVGINWDRGYRPECQGERTLDRDQSLRLVTSLRTLIPKIPASFSLRPFTCVVGVDLGNLRYSSCGLTLERHDDRDSRLIAALENAGVAKYVGRDNVTENYEVFGLSCSETTQLKNLRCKLNAYWKKDCPVNNP